MIYSMSDSPIDRKQCDHCRSEIPRISAHCPLCGEKQEFETAHTPTEEPEPETDADSDNGVATSDGSEITWSDVKDTKTASRADLVFTFLSLGVYLGGAAAILIGFHGVYRVAIGSSMFVTTIAWMFIAFAVVAVIGGLNELLRRLSPTYRLVTKVKQ